MARVCLPAVWQALERVIDRCAPRDSTRLPLGINRIAHGAPQVYNLGTDRHRKKYCDDIDCFRLPGCFAMTELQHGSNVAGLKTEAVLDLSSDEARRFCSSAFPPSSYPMPRDAPSLSPIHPCPARRLPGCC